VIILASAAAIGLIGALARAGERRRRVAAACGLVSVALLGLASHGLYDRRGAPFYVSELTGMEERHRGMARFDDGRYEEAAVAFREALAVQDDPITRTNLGNALQAAGRFDEAAMEYERSLQMNRGSALTWYNYGILLMKFPERLGQAEQSLGEAIRRAPRMSGAHLRLGEVYLRAGRPRAAVPALERSLELTGADESARARARELLTIARSRIEENDVPAD
jgi:tetratricopeptide (TPR) repeat protein